MRFLIRIGIIIVAVAVFIVGFVLLTDYKPPAELLIEAENENNDVLMEAETLTLSIMNIGYGGLDKDQDFFMDGGRGSRSTSLEKTSENIDKAVHFMNENSSDVYLIQEVDINSSRTYKFNEREYIKKKLSTFNSVSATYYKVPYVPVPIEAPLGKVEMALLTLSKGQIASTIRFELPNERKMPDKFFLLDRCMMETVIPLNNGKNLIVLNVHLSAYDSNGTVKKAQLTWIEEYIKAVDLDENYYIFGGDWNLVLKELSQEKEEKLRDYWIEKPKDFKKGGFEWIYDDAINTVRELDAPYKKGETYEQVIDGFLISPNLEVLSVKTHDLAFEFSDHNPVSIKIKFK